MGPTRVDGIFTKTSFVTEKLFSVIQIMPSSKYLSQIWKSVFLFRKKTSVKQLSYKKPDHKEKISLTCLCSQASLSSSCF